MTGAGERVLERVGAAEPAAEVEVAVSRNRLALTRFANSVIHQNVAEDTLGVHVTMHRDGRTVSGSSTVADESRLPGARRPHRRRGAARPAGPRLARVGATCASRSGGPARSGDGGRLAGRPGGHRSRRSSTPPEGWRPPGTAGPTTGRARSSTRPGRPSRGRAPTSAWRASPGGRAATASLGRRLAGWPTSTVPCSVPAPRRRPTPASIRSSCRPTATRSCSSRRPSPTSSRRSRCTASTPRPSPSGARSCVSATSSSTRAVDLVDDAPGAGLGYDAEGTPRRRLVLVDGGTTVALTHDRRTAATAGATSTGHGVGSAAFGAIARHLVLLGADAPGAVAAEVEGPVVDSATAELVAGVERGVLVTDFWYTRVLDPRSLAITGLTRNGVWLIEHGEVTHTAAQLPLHAVLRPGPDAGRGARRRSGGRGDARRHVLGEHAAVDGARAAPGVVELHGRGERLIRVCPSSGRSAGQDEALGWSVGR